MPSIHETIEGHTKRIIAYTGFMKNELLCIEHLPGFHHKDFQRFRNDIYRLIKNSDAVIGIPKKAQYKEMQDEVENIIIDYQEIVIGILEASPEKLEKIKQLLEDE